MGDMNDPFMRNQAVQARPKVQNRSNVLQLKLMGQSHPTGLTPNLLKLFEPRPPLEFLPPPEKRKCPPYTGMAQFVSGFAEPGDPEYAPPKPEVETPAQKRERIHKSRLEKGVEKAAEDLQKYDPNNDPNASGDPYKTLFVARLNYETSESKIKREFEAYGPIKQVHLVTDQQTNKPKGYAFIEYLNTRDMKAAYKQGDGKKIDGRRVLVDVERGRTVPNWRPRRLGGGLGTTRVTGEKIAGEEEQQQPSQARTSRSEEPKAREDREKSRDRGKEREREVSHERSRERSHERSRERSRDRPRESHREDKHHRDRDRGRDRGDRDRESRRDRGDRDRRSRDHDRERSRKRDRDYESGEYEEEGEYERGGSKQRRGESEEGHGYYEGRSRRSSHYEREEEQGGDQDRYDDRYGRVEEEEYRYDDLLSKSDGDCSVISNRIVLLLRRWVPVTASDEKTKKDASADSSTSVLSDEENSEEILVGKEILLAKDGDSSLISEAMAQEEEQLLKLREDEEKAKCAESGEATDLNDTQFTKLDELLTQTQLYSEFLLEKMEDITKNGIEGETQKAEPEKKGGRGRKRKPATQAASMKAKKAVAAMISRSKEGHESANSDLTEEERVMKEQSELVPLLTGGKLKSYQLKGVKWLISLWQNGLNGILADQMGLGKTIQTIGFLSHLKGNGLDGPYLVIAPLSTLSNWMNEIARFTPSINAIIYHGDKKKRDELRRKHMPKTVGPKFPIVITSYEVAMNDARKNLRHYPWKYVVIDEGHRLKNHQCKLLRELRHMKMENKLLLTGTPLQNNLSELWSLLNFILPDIFASHDEFESWFDFSEKNKSEASKEEGEEKRKAQVVAKLHSILRPFILRRMKCDVELLLPRKKEIIIYATMTDHQKNFQDHLVNRTLEAHLGENAIPGQGWKGKLNNLVIQLRKNCNHPDLLAGQIDGSYFYPPIEDIVGQCGKFRLLERLLVRLFAKNHRVLVFTQWTKILDIMDYYFSEKGFEVCRIDGNVKLDERRRQIDEFNDEKSSCRIFLLSTRAGGLGINLTAADTCILYDSDWNPQMDLQAMDRCHRIGQTKPVHVYRLATAQSVEGRVLKRAYSKLKLEHVVIGKGQFHQERAKSSIPLEEEDILALLKDDETAEDKLIQTDISEEDLDRLLDRSDLMITSPGETEPEAGEAFPVKGPGWEVVLPSSAGGMLSSLNS
ncbi:hypothetical protein IGI04_033758 [Brassica rapa subsp. trilocularis]|uniref:U1 small nuclear ribonucleoprotein 70 kDa n=2 Tax=Brassica campestris TaxID=3711 RepID=A0A3P5XWB5_BRACM|nr:hypothetical protein IGI04_033758 [Brassica rapa subsp. trilocularis]VDC59016.1 unnamed protein product [Brassica rapa]